MSDHSPVDSITIVGNCQAPVLAKIIKACSIPNLEVNSFVLHRDPLDKLDDLVESKNSTILAVPFNSVRGNASFSWRHLSQRYPLSKIHMITNAFFEGYHPYWGYFYNSKGKKIYPAWDDYINYFIVSKYLKDRTTDLSSALIFEEMLDRNIYEAIWSRSQAELAKRELESASITNIASLLDISSVEQDQLFWTCNHPTRKIFDYMILQIFDCLGIDIKSAHTLQSISSYEFLSKTKMPIYSQLNNKIHADFSNINYIFNGEVYSWEKVVQMHLIFLEKQDMDNIDYSLHRYIEIRPELVSIL